MLTAAAPLGATPLAAGEAGRAIPGRLLMLTTAFGHLHRRPANGAIPPEESLRIDVHVEWQRIDVRATNEITVTP